MGIDGMKMDVPDTSANEAAFGRPRGGRGDGAFPQVHKVSLVELGSRGEMAFVVKPCMRNEAVIAWGLRRHIQPGMLVLADREFFSFPLWQAYLAAALNCYGAAKATSCWNRSRCCPTVPI